MVGASNAYNQIIERNLDALMDRTKNRPLPAGRMTVGTAFTIATIFTILGLIVLYIINPKTAMFGAISIFLYVSIYTPLKTKTPLSVFVGAFPGAIPFMLGWVAATGKFSIEPGTLFMIQFFWQFPHFWAIGWWLFEDYKKGGFFYVAHRQKRSWNRYPGDSLYLLDDPGVADSCFWCYGKIVPHAGFRSNHSYPGTGNVVLRLPTI